MSIVVRFAPESLTALMPILVEVGVDAGEPEVFEVHNIIER